MNTNCSPAILFIRSEARISIRPIQPTPQRAEPRIVDLRGDTSALRRVTNCVTPLQSQLMDLCAKAECCPIRCCWAGTPYSRQPNLPSLISGSPKWQRPLVTCGARLRRRCSCTFGPYRALLVLPGSSCMVNQRLVDANATLIPDVPRYSSSSSVSCPWSRPLVPKPQHGIRILPVPGKAFSVASMLIHYFCQQIAEGKPPRSELRHSGVTLPLHDCLRKVPVHE
jgi:hypothetical protein